MSIECSSLRDFTDIDEAKVVCMDAAVELAYTSGTDFLCYNGSFFLEDGENVLEFINVVAKNGADEIEFDQGKFILDFGGCPAGFEAKVSNIIIQKHQN